MPTSLGETFEQIAPPPRPPNANDDRDRSESGLWDGDGFSFSDILDIVNPLQHIPGLAYLYREVTGDEIGHAPRVLGGALFGGLIGAIVSLVNVIVDEETGKDMGEHAIALVFDDGVGNGDGGGDETAPDSVPGATVVASTAAFSPMSDAVFDPAFTAASAPAIASGPLLARARAAQAQTTITVDAADGAARGAARGAGGRAAAGLPPARGVRDPESPAETVAQFDAVAQFDKSGGVAYRPAGEWLGETMMYGLDRYRAMAQERARAVSAATRQAASVLDGEF